VVRPFHNPKALGSIQACRKKNKKGKRKFSKKKLFI
jgi:hypothetical protein